MTSSGGNQNVSQKGRSELATLCVTCILFNKFYWTEWKCKMDRAAE